MAEQHRRHNETVLRTLEVGDLVEFNRVFIKHWGVYVGDKEIVHLFVDDRSGTVSKAGCVKKENFWSVAEQSTTEKNNDKDGEEWPLCKEEIKKRALSKLGPSFYNALTYNCEHFANWCRYGVCESAQVSVHRTFVEIKRGRFKGKDIYNMPKKRKKPVYH